MGRVFVVPLSGGPPRELKGFSRGRSGVPVAFSPDGRRLAAAPPRARPQRRSSASGTSRAACRACSGRCPRAGEGAVGGVTSLAFLDDDHLVTSSRTTGIVSFDRATGRPAACARVRPRRVAVDRRRGTVFAFLGAPDELVRIDLDGQEPTKSVFSCPGCYSVAVDPTGTMVATGGVTRSCASGRPPGASPISSSVVPRPPARGSPSRPTAAGSRRAGSAPAVRLWPVPDVTRTPLHRRSHEEVLATLRSWTNLRAVKDPQSSTGWKLEPGPFPGWAKLPQR